MLRKTTIALAVLLLSKLGLAAASDPCKATSSTSDVRFELALKDGRATFQEGEIIPLALSFSSAVKDRYLAEDRNYDRSGRLEIELYCAEPQAPDPLEDYFRQGAFGGGIGGIHKLDTPLIAEAELNEWRKLAPGHYRIYAISHRVSRMPDPAEQTPYGRVSEVVRSNTVDLDVIAPSPKWQSERISEAVHALAGAPSPDVARHAARILRFLNTQVSTRQLAGLFLGLNERQPVGWDLMFGLYGSPFRKLAIDSMHNEIGAPAHAITAEFLRTLVDLQIAADPAWDPPPAALANPGGAQEFWERRRAHTLALTKAETEKVVAALDAKAGSVRAETLNGVLMGGGLDESLAQTIHPVLIDAWPNLSEATERDLIQYRWPLIKGEDMLPILRRIVALPPPRGGTPAAEMRDAALKHIAELDPEAGRALILRDAMGGTASPSLSTIGLLPADDIAAVVKASVQRELSVSLYDTARW